MYRQATRQRRGVQTARTASRSAPVGGLNARDPIASMGANDAVILTNWFCTPFDVQIRQGYKQHVTGITGNVETIAAYNGPTSSSLFAANTTEIYDVTTAGTVGAAVVSGQTNGRWQHVNFATTGGNFLVMVNGADKLQLYNGAAWAAIDGASVPAITGVTTSTLIHVCSHKRRLWFVQSGTQKAWYLPVDSVGGAATQLDLGAVFQMGGYLMAAETWTIDAGAGMDDHLVFISSRGEVAVYKGTDPASASTWALVGVWQIGAPINRRCMIKYGGDVLYISRDGVVPISKALLSSRVNTRIAITDKIQHLVSDDVGTYSSAYGWDILLFPNSNMLIMNVPESTALSHQYVMNTISGAWSRWEGMNSFAWELFEDQPYFGGTGGVYLAWSGWSDNANSSGDNGQNITTRLLTAFDYYGGSTQLKRWTIMRPVFSSSGVPGVLLQINVDFDRSAPTGSASVGQTFAGTTWGGSTWGGGQWNGNSLTITKAWQAAGGVGYCGALSLATASNGIEVRLQAIDYAVEFGGAI